MIESWITPKAQKGVTSGIAGRGLVAKEPIERGEVVAVKGGHIVTTVMLQALPERLQNSEVQITDDLHLVAPADDEYKPVMLFINHSCEPNVGFGGNIVLVAMRDIEAGEDRRTRLAASRPARAVPRVLLVVSRKADSWTSITGALRKASPRL